HALAEALDVAASLKIVDDFGVSGARCFRTVGKLRAFCFGEHQIADGKLADLASLECPAEIFLTSLNPTFADLNVWRGELLRARRRMSSALHLRFKINYQIIWSDVIADSTALVVD